MTGPFSSLHLLVVISLLRRFVVETIATSDYSGDDPLLSSDFIDRGN